MRESKQRPEDQRGGVKAIASTFKFLRHFKILSRV
jgi:hypothetical protein